MMQAGAAGYLLKDLGRDGLFEAITQVYAGKQWLPERISSRLNEGNARRDLTRRELELRSRSFAAYPITRSPLFCPPQRAQ